MATVKKLQHNIQTTSGPDEASSAALRSVVDSELPDSERRLEALLDQLPHVILYETGANREYISRNIQKLLGFEAEEFTGERGSFAKIIHPDDADQLYRRLSAWIENGRPGVFRAQFRARTRSGEYIWLEDQIVGAEHPDGKHSLIGVMVDVTTRLADQERYRAIVEAADAAGLGLGVFLERHGAPELVFMNASLQSIGGWTLEELRERGLFSILPADNLQPALEVWKALSSGTIEKHAFETAILRKDGTVVPISLGLSSTRIDGERAIISFITDIGERKRAEEELIRAKLEAEEMSRVKSNILANFSHELRTPMHAILGFSSMLVEELTDPEQLTYARSIQRSGLRLLDTLTSIIELSALESSPGEISLYPTRLSDLVREVAELHRPVVELKHLQFCIDITDTEAIVLLDLERFRKTMDKILHNAIKFTTAGKICVRQYRQEIEHQGRRQPCAFISIEDTGIGMSQDFIDNAFEKFKQESTGLGREYEGAGLGLTLARGYLRLMNGSITISSSPDKGTTVTLILPIVG